MNLAGILKQIGCWIWVVVRFVLFGCAGFWIMLYGACMVMVRVLGGNARYLINPFLCLLLILIGAFMMLYGTGEWKRPAYLWVFLSMPLALFAVLLIPELPGDKGSPVILVGFVAFFSNALVRVYYKRKALSEKKTHNEQGPASATEA